MKKTIILTAAMTTLFVLVGCGGGGGVYYSPETAINSIGLKKIKLRDTGITQYDKQFFPVSSNESKERDAVIEKSIELFKGRGVYFSEVTFNNETYYIKEDQGLFRSIKIIRKKDMHTVGEVPPPRNVYSLAAFPIKFNKREYLTIYVEQRPTSHSSTLFILDSSFKVVYQDHLLGAEEVGHGDSIKLGNYIVIKSEAFWFPDGVNKPRADINGNWLYYMPVK